MNQQREHQGMARKPPKMHPTSDALRFHQLSIAEEQASRLVGSGGRRLPAAIRTGLVGRDIKGAYQHPEVVDQSGQTPLSVLLGTGGGRGGANRLKLLLTLLWTAKKEPFDVRWQHAVYAYLIGLDGSSQADRRTIGRNLQWLLDNGFLRQPTGTDGTKNCVLMEETLSGREYTQPWKGLRETPSTDPSHDAHYYFKVPADLWTGGLIMDLSAAGLACLMVVLDDLRRRTAPTPEAALWWASTTWRARYGLSDDTRQRGLGELLDRKIVMQRPGHPIPSLENPLNRHPTYVLARTALDGRDVEDESHDAD